MDVVEELGKKIGFKFLQLIGIMILDIDFGWVDICLETPLVSQCQEALYHIFTYIQSHPDMGRLE